MGRRMLGKQIPAYRTGKPRRTTTFYGETPQTIARPDKDFADATGLQVQPSLPRRGRTYQPWATPWGEESSIRQSPERATQIAIRSSILASVSPFQGFFGSFSIVTQGVALG